MSRKNKKKDFQNEGMQMSRKTYTFRVLNTTGPVPIARPNDFIQLTPAVQPVQLFLIPIHEAFGGDPYAGEGADDYNEDYDYADDFIRK